MPSLQKYLKSSIPYPLLDHTLLKLPNPKARISLPSIMIASLSTTIFNGNLQDSILEAWT